MQVHDGCDVYHVTTADRLEDTDGDIILESTSIMHCVEWDVADGVKIIKQPLLLVGWLVCHGAWF